MSLRSLVLVAAALAPASASPHYHAPQAIARDAANSNAFLVKATPTAGDSAVLSEVTGASMLPVEYELLRARETTILLPTCATSCIYSAVVSESPCELTDAPCACESENFITISSKASGCVITACGYMTAQYAWDSLAAPCSTTTKKTTSHKTTTTAAAAATKTSSSSSSSSSGRRKKKTSGGVIGGIVAGVVAGVTIIGGIIHRVIIKMRKKRADEAARDGGDGDEKMVADDANTNNGGGGAVNELDGKGPGPVEMVASVPTHSSANTSTPPAPAPDANSPASQNVGQYYEGYVMAPGQPPQGQTASVSPASPTHPGLPQPGVVYQEAPVQATSQPQPGVVYQEAPSQPTPQPQQAQLVPQQQQYANAPPPPPTGYNS